MKEDIFFYNFGWNDYGVWFLEFIFDMVKVMLFVLKEGKVVVYCYVGFGRIGVFIVCYFVFLERIGVEEVIYKVWVNRFKVV